MTTQIGEERGTVAPAPTPEPKPTTDPATPPVEGGEGELNDIDFEKELEKLEAGENTPPAKPKRSELEKASHAFRSTAKRIKELGGDPSTMIDDAEDPPEQPAADEGRFVTKLDLARTEVARLAKSPAESKLIMWYVENKGLTVTEAHFLANKGKVAKSASEIDRARGATPSMGGGDPGERTPEIKIHKMNEAQEKRLATAGLVHDPATNSYTGKKTRVRHNGANWVSERLVNGKWVKIDDASQYDG